MSIKQMIARIFLFHFILLLLLVLLSFVFMPKNNTEEAGMYNVKANGILGAPENSIDVLVIGDSEAYANISPLDIYDEYGITMYITGTPAQLINTSYDFLKKALKTQKPKIVILEAYNIFRDVSLGRVGKNFAQGILPIFLYHNRWKSLTFRDFNFEVDYTWTDELKGYNFSKKLAPSKNDDYMTKNKKNTKISSINMFYLEKIRKLCEEENISFMLLNTPNYKGWNYKRHQVISDYASKYQIDYLDMNVINDEIKIDWLTDTRDKGDHLNYNGALKVSKYLGNYLTSKMEFQNHKGETKYASWEKDLQKFKEKVQLRKQLHSYDHD
ncbi:putative uncharacterized protein [Mycoplasma sp. CAG:776]|nr:putative uncharacterized protein [Mycoplasma sp. CAG:776]